VQTSLRDLDRTSQRGTIAGEEREKVRATKPIDRPAAEMAPVATGIFVMEAGAP
jgi:hypothetical protein